MKVLVTGGAGFIGSHLVDALVDQGADVIVFDNLSTGSERNLQPHLQGGRARLVRDSILNPDALEPHVRWCDRIVHLAAVVGVRRVVEDPLSCISVNVAGTHNVLALAAEYGVRTVIASSSEVYGRSVDVPLHEGSDRVLGPTTVARWSYADGKAVDEHLALAYGSAGLPVSIVRYFNAYGPRMGADGYGSVVARFVQQALRGEPLTIYDDGAQTRSFTYVSDTVLGTVLAAARDAAIGEVFNIGSEKEITINNLARLVLEITGSESGVLHRPAASVYGPGFEETRRRVPDAGHAHQLLGFAPQVPLEEGLRRTVNWFRSLEPAA